MSEIVVELPTLHAGQIEAHQAYLKHRFLALRCGRRWGKTAFLSTLAADTATKGQLFGLFAPDYKRLTETYQEVARILAPIVKRKSQTSGTIRTINGGLVEFWTLEDEDAGRSRKYHVVGLDEAAFTKPNMSDIWRKSIKPTLLDYRGRCIAASNTSGQDVENFFWKITNQPELGFKEYHAPSRSNPFLPADEIEALRATEHPLVFLQEYEAEWVDWSGVAFFSLEKLLVDGQPVSQPARCDAVFAIIDSAAKAGTENDGTGVVYCARNNLGDGPPLTFVDWETHQIEGALLETWLPTVFERLEQLAREMKARAGSLGVWIEDKSTGIVLNQQANRKGWPARPIDSQLTSLGKDERAISVSGYFHRGEVKISRPAYEKTMIFKSVSRNHLIAQLCGFRIGDKAAAKRADDLLDCAVYAAAISLGNEEGF